MARYTAHRLLGDNTLKAIEKWREEELGKINSNNVTSRTV